MIVPVVLLWIIQEAPLTFNGAPGNVGGSLAGVYYVCNILYLEKKWMYVWPKLWLWSNKLLLNWILISHKAQKRQIRDREAQNENGSDLPFRKVVILQNLNWSNYIYLPANGRIDNYCLLPRLWNILDRGTVSRVHVILFQNRMSN